MRKNSLTRQVRRAYSQDTLQRICTLREDRFGRAFGMRTVSVAQHMRKSAWSRSDQSEDYYHFRDNGSSVLAVAHLDTVVSQKGRTPHFRATERGPLVVSGALDDRLGAYVILHLLPELGVSCDWLLTVGEESGASTAEYFDARGKKYDWVIEFDRGGTDVVMYQYEDNASVRLVEAAGAKVGWGSFSDIASLEQLNVKAFNWGVGYKGNYHSESGYAYLNDTFAMVAKYLRFHEQNAGTALPHEPGRRSGYYDSYDDDYYGDCDVCMVRAAVDSVTGYCLSCKSCQDCGLPEDGGCMCYVPRHIRDEAAEAGSQVLSITPASKTDPDRDWRDIGWKDYLSRRPGAWSTDGGETWTCTDCDKSTNACTCAQDDADTYAAQYGDPDVKADPAAPRSPSLAPPWSEHRPSGYRQAKPPTSRKDRKSWNRELSPGALSEDLVTAVTASRKLAAVNPPAVFPDADPGWHEATRKSADGPPFVAAHQPGQAWARICLRCAARWPHPVSSADIHPESDCPGCERCGSQRSLGQHRLATGAIHVIPAHLAGESDLCGLCRELNTGPDAAGAGLREIAALTETDR